MQLLDDNRAVSEVLGYAIIIGITFTAVGGITIGALTIVDTEQSQQAAISVDDDFETLDSNIHSIESIHQQQDQSITLPEGQLQTADNTTITINGIEMQSQTLVYQTAEEYRTIYDTGLIGIQRSVTTEQSRSPTTWNPSTNIIQLPLIEFTPSTYATGQGDTSVQINQTSPDTSAQPDPEAQRPQTLSTTEITIESPYPDLWTAYFDQHSSVSIDQNEDTLTLTFAEEQTVITTPITITER